MAKSDDKLSISTGGTPSNNTYNWYYNNQLESTIVGDSTFTPTNGGSYYVQVTNSICTSLTLFSDTVNYFKIIDPNPSMIANDGSINQDISNLDKSKTVTAAATDGVTKLLLVADSKDPVIFSIEGDKNGTLSSLNDQKTNAVSISIQPDVNGKVVAVYTVPDGFGENYDVKDGRYITVETVNQNNEDDTSSLIIKLVTPPVVLIHVSRPEIG